MSRCIHEATPCTQHLLHIGPVSLSFRRSFCYLDVAIATSAMGASSRATRRPYIWPQASAARELMRGGDGRAHEVWHSASDMHYDCIHDTCEINRNWQEARILQLAFTRPQPTHRGGSRSRRPGPSAQTSGLNIETTITAQIRFEVAIRRQCSSRLSGRSTRRRRSPDAAEEAAPGQMPLRLPPRLTATECERITSTSLANKKCSSGVPLLRAPAAAPPSVSLL